MRYTVSFVFTSLLALPAWAEVPHVVTDVPPVHSLVAQVMGDLGQPDLLLDRGADAHSFQLRPSQAQALADADLLIWIGPELTPWLERALGDAERPQLRLAAIDGFHRRTFGPDTHDHASEEAGHDHVGLDPHLWLDPGNAALWLGAIAAALGHQDPEHAAEYAANAAAARSKIEAMDAETAARLQHVQAEPIYVFHDAYGYFAAHYGLTVAGSIAAADASAPGAAHLAELRSEIAVEARCIFPEVQHDPKLVERIAEETGAKVGAALDPEGSLLEPGRELYGQLIRGLAEKIADCAAP